MTMWGLGIAVVIALVRLAMGRDFLYIYERATGFLFKWYLVTAVLITVVLSVLVVTGSSILGLLFGGLIGAIGGWAVGSVVAVLVIVSVALAYVCQIVGAKMLHNALTINASGHSWNGVQVGIGLVLLVLGVMVLPGLS